MKRVIAATTCLLLAAGLGACSGENPPDPAVATSTAQPSTTLAPTSTSVATTSTSQFPSTGNAEIDALLAQSRTAAYHVVYEDDSGTSLELTRDGNQAVLRSGTQSIYQLDGGVNVVCERSSAPTCTDLPAGPGALDSLLSSLFGIFGAVVAGSASDTSPFAATTEITDDTIAGRAARCVSVSVADRGYSLCIDAEIGILLRLETDPGSGTPTNLVATTVEVGPIDPTTFTLPN